MWVGLRKSQAFSDNICQMLIKYLVCAHACVCKAGSPVLPSGLY